MIANLLSKEEFEQAIQAEGLLIVEFTASWHPSCQNTGHKVQELANGLQDGTKIVRVDVDQNPGAAEAAEIEEKPTY